MKKIFVLLFILSSTFCGAQTRWYNPKTEGAILHGQAMQDEARSNYYHRLPDTVKNSVRDAVWNLSRNTAGVSIKFNTNSKQIVVKYVVSEGHSMQHMPTTGKSGLDLYATNNNGTREWCAARHSFGDTITYSYAPLYYNGSDFKYELDLPPYNTVTYLKIGVDESSNFKFVNPSAELPIITYGTSITQGACASRPGMIWTSIIRRELETPLINLGFSGNGLLESGILNVIKSTPAKLIILDCLPNVYRYDNPKIIELTINAVKEIREAQPNVPIILTDHLGYPHSTMVRALANRAELSNKANLEAYKELLDMGYLNLYHLTYDDIAMPNDGTVEGIHPSDYGMRAYADAYISLIREVLNMSKGELSTQQAVTQQRDSYNWLERHAEILSTIKQTPPKTVVIGNSIMHQWGGVKSNNYPCMIGLDSWNKESNGDAVVNMGAGWDMIENVLWRVQHGILDGYNADKIIVAIGVNNLNNSDTPNEISEGIRTLIQAIKYRQPKAELKICGIFPMRSAEKTVKDINKLIKKVAKEERVTFEDPGKLLLTNKNKIDITLFKGDGLHLNESGYNRIAKEFFK